MCPDFVVFCSPPCGPPTFEGVAPALSVFVEGWLPSVLALAVKDRSILQRLGKNEPATGLYKRTNV